MKKINLISGETIEEVVSLRPIIGALLRKHSESSVQITVTLPPEKQELGAFLPDSVSVRFSRKIEPSFMNIRCSLATNEIVDGENPDWLALLDSTSKIGNRNPYHRIDLLRKVAGVDSCEADFDLPSFPGADEKLPSSLFEGQGPKIALCLSSLELEDASQAVSASIEALPNCNVFLVGTLTDKRKAQVLLEMFEGKRSLLFDLCGRLSPIALARTLQLCDLAILGPGPAAQLASGYGTLCVCVDRQSMNLDLPYGHGHLVIRPEVAWNEAAFSPLLGEMLAFIFQTSTPPCDETWREFSESRLHNYLGRIRLFLQQRVELRFNDGSFTLEMYQRPLIYMGASFTDTVRCLYRLIWEKTFADRTITTQELSILHDETVPLLTQDLPGLRNLCELAEFGMQYSRQVGRALSTGDIALAKSISEKLQEVEELTHSVGQKFPLCTPMTDFHQTRQAILPNTAPMQLALSMEDHFSQMKLRGIMALDLVQNLFRSTVETYRDSAISLKGEAGADV